MYNWKDNLTILSTVNTKIIMGVPTTGKTVLKKILLIKGINCLDTDDLIWQNKSIVISNILERMKKKYNCFNPYDLCNEEVSSLLRSLVLFNSLSLMKERENSDASIQLLLTNFSDSDSISLIRSAGFSLSEIFFFYRKPKDVEVLWMKRNEENGKIMKPSKSQLNKWFSGWEETARVIRNNKCLPVNEYILDYFPAFKEYELNEKILESHLYSDNNQYFSKFDANENKED